MGGNGVLEKQYLEEYQAKELFDVKSPFQRGSNQVSGNNFG